MKNLNKILAGLTLGMLSFQVSAQCPTITCAADVTVNNDAGMCGAVVNYTTPTAVDSCASLTFTYTGAQQSFVVPAGVTSISVDAYGAQGGSNSPSTNINFGGRVQADIPVTPGTTVYVYVGEQPTGLTGGFNGGGNGETAGAGGGGASDIRIGGTTLNDRVLVAGGAGGGGFWSSQEVHGGLGGGLTAGNGYRTSFSSAPGGEGGTQTSSGNGTCVSLNNPAMAGGFGYGGAPSGCGCEGYGGGGGWYGGAGSGNCRGGGGGSSYTDPSATNVIHTQGVRAGHGEITVSWGGIVATQIAGIPSGGTFPVGTTTNTFVAQSLGGADTCSFLVTVIDTEAPIVTCSSNVEICAGESLQGSMATATDLCSTPTITYSGSGATVFSGTTSMSGIAFNEGTTDVWCVATDSSGNQDSCSFQVLANALPTVTLAAFSVDTTCINYAPIALPAGTPASGVYTGNGVTGTNFDPTAVSTGQNWVYYSYTDSLGCTNTDSTAIYVDGCASVNELSGDFGFTLYPNPTSGVVNIVVDGYQGEVKITVTSIEGKLVKEILSDSNNTINVDLSKEVDGIYYLDVETSLGSKRTKLIKEN